MRRLPVVATLIVLAAVGAMVALGLWQLDRAREKEALLARYQANLTASPLVLRDRVDLATNMFRRATIRCAPRPGTQVSGAGRFGFRLLADCGQVEDGQTLWVQLGTVPRPTAKLPWAGGIVTGYLTQAPDNRSVLRRSGSSRESEPMIVAVPALAGLGPNPGPSLAEVPNNHRSYAFQWFAFAGVALIIYGLALRSRWKGQA